MAAIGITDLNFDVLDVIFANLPNLVDKISLGQSHPCLGEAFASHCLYGFQNIKFDSLPVEKWSFLLSACGGSVKVLANCNTTVIRKVLFPREFKYNVHIDLLRTMESKQKIKEISVRVTDNLNLVDPVLRALRNLPALRKLDILNFGATEVHYVNNLTELEVLSVQLLRSQKFDVFRILSGLRNLRSLEIYGGILDKTEGTAPVWPLLEHFSIKNAEVKNNFPYFPKLKTLSISCVNSRAIVLQPEYANHLEKLEIRRSIRGGTMKEAKVIGTLKSLKELCWHTRDDICLEYLTNLNQLENLTLVKSNGITPTGLLKVLRACKKIRYLEIEQCAKIELSFVWSVKVIVHENMVKTENPLHLKLKLDRHFSYANSMALQYWTDDERIILDVV